MHENNVKLIRDVLSWADFCDYKLSRGTSCQVLTLNLIALLPLFFDNSRYQGSAADEFGVQILTKSVSLSTITTCACYEELETTCSSSQKRELLILLHIVVEVKGVYALEDNIKATLFPSQISL